MLMAFMPAYTKTDWTCDMALNISNYEYEHLYNEFLAILTRARELYMELKSASQPVTVRQKGGKANYVTDIDLQIQRFLYDNIKAVCPNADFLMEEKEDYIAAFKSLGELFIIDPIDGTNNCMHGYASAAISLAYVRNKDLCFGAVYALESDELFFAIKGGGAYLNGQGISVSNKKLEQGLVCMGTAPYNRECSDISFKIAQEMFNCSEDVRRLGSAAIEICNVACGRAEVFYEIRLLPWDYAAAMLILSEAGGRLTTFYGKEPLLNEATSILATNGITHDRAMDIIKYYLKPLKEATI